MYDDIIEKTIIDIFQVFYHFNSLTLSIYTHVKIHYISIKKHHKMSTGWNSLIVFTTTTTTITVSTTGNNNPELSLRHTMNTTTKNILMIMK